MYKVNFLILLLIILFFPVYAWNADYYVNVNTGSNLNSGASKDNAWKTLTFALSKGWGSGLDPVTIHVAEGFYSPASGEVFPLQMKNYVSLWGGSQENTIIDAQETASVINCAGNPDDIDPKFWGVEGVSLKKLTIQNGKAPLLGGGGIYCFYSSPFIIECSFKNNKATYGGGIYCDQAHSIEFISCEFYTNSSNKNGGAIFFSQCNNPLVKGCKFSQNLSKKGGGIYTDLSSPVIIETEFSENAASDSGGGFYCYESTPNITGCNFIENTSPKGGGIYIDDVMSNQAVLSNCEIKNNSGGEGVGIYFDDTSPSLNNCLISSNFNLQDKLEKQIEFSRGAGFFCFNASPKISNCTIADNVASEYGGIFDTGSKMPILTNCIVWENGSDPVTQTAAVMFSDVEGEEKFPGIGNLNDDPLFASGPSGNYYLSQTEAGQEGDSPCIDIGNDTAERLGLDNMSTRTDGLPDQNVVDIGYHYSPLLKVDFSLNTFPKKDSYTTNDNFNLLLDIKTGELTESSDVYLVMLNPSGEFFSALDWFFELKPLLVDFDFPQNISLYGITLLNITIPNSKPSLQTPGTYTFAIAAFETGTAELFSNLSIISFEIE